MGFLDSAEAYEAMGVEPPEVIPHGSESDLALARELNTHKHHWEQRGNDVWCSRGEHVHGHHVPTTHILTGTDDNGVAQFKIIDNSFPSSNDNK